MADFLQDLPGIWAKDKWRPWSGLAGGALAQALSRLGGRSLLVVTPSEKEAEALVEELSFFGAPALLLPGDDTRPYDGQSPHPSRPRQRIRSLYALAQGKEALVVTSVSALVLRHLPLQAIQPLASLCADQEIDPVALGKTLLAGGYLPVGRVEDEGSFRLRGDRLDIWPNGAALPIRVEFFDVEVETLRQFDPETQRSGDAIEGCVFLPASELVLSTDSLERASTKLQERVESVPDGIAKRRQILTEWREGLRFSGSDEELAALFELQPLWEVLSGVSRLVIDPEGCRRLVETTCASIQNRYDAVPLVDRPMMPLESRFVSTSNLLGFLNSARAVLNLAEGDSRNFDCRSNDTLRPSGQDLGHVLGKIGAWLEDGWRVGLVVENSLRAERVEQLLRPHGLQSERTGERNPDRWTPGVLQLMRGRLPRGFHTPTAQIALLAADEIFGRKHRVRAANRSFSKVAKDAAVQSFSELQQGDLIVHRVHGIGLYIGLSQVDVGRGTQDMLQVEYRGGDRLYLPVHNLNDIARYRAAGEGKKRPMLDKLGGETWNVRKQKLKDAMLRYAHEILRIQASRQVVEGHAYDGVSQRFREFEEAFPFVETTDQAAAIADVLQDLATPKPMDRLIVGDVGFGKTEVALRAAMRVADEGRQVAVLCPTTVLAYQHFQSFKERFEPFGIRVALLSRFRSTAQKRAVLADLRSGEVRVVIGTTGILGRSVGFQDLGLLVVDEEHRFGVRQKENLKKLAVNVDYLAMSATPIPRSLHMALSDLRCFSLIATPPLDRLPIRTALARYSVGRIREDLMRELRRGGQAFFVHNRVATIHQVARVVEEAVPEAKVSVAHGQMNAKELERVLVDFINGTNNVLVCTAIIESGVDLPNVNTILVNNADQFGMAQLYQLRGRVGRSHVRGYCTLLLEHGKTLTAVAVQRLRALQENTALGSGFAVASADMDIRGAGDLLGAKQHGHIQAVGFETYLELLEEAISEAHGDQHRSRIEPEVELPGAAFLPEDFVPGVPERLGFYKRLANSRTIEEVKSLAGEVEDLYGSMPIEALGLFRLQEIKARCREMGILSIHWLKVRCLFAFDPSALPDEKRLVRMLKAHPARMRLLDGDRLQVGFSPGEAKLPHVFLHWVFQQLEK